MGKTRAEIQKAYRERQKAKGPAYLQKERLRIQSYYVPAEQLSSKKLKERNQNSKLRNRLSRLRKRQNEDENKAQGETSGYGSMLSPASAEESDNTHSDNGSKLVVKLPSAPPSKGIGVRKRNARYLSRANRTIVSLKTELSSLKKKIATKSRQLRRLKQKKSHTTDGTPSRQTESDISGLNITPRSRQTIRKKLFLANVVMAEIGASKDATKTKQRHILHNVIAGRISRNAIAKCNLKTYNHRREIRNCLSRHVEGKVIEFLQREDNSRMQPGKSDAKTDASNNKSKVQCLVLTDYLRNLHLKFLAENTDIKLSFATFCRLHPKNILLAAFITRNACQCLRHQNMALKVQALKKAGIKLSGNPEALLQRTDVDEVLQALPDTLDCRMWKRVQMENGTQKMKIVEFQVERAEFIETFKAELLAISEHVDRVRQQYHELHTLKENLPEHEFIVQMDFAENFSCRSLDEVQTAYWHQTSVTLHPVVVYWMDSGKLLHKSYVIISDVLSHSPSTVCSFIDALLPQLKLMDPDVRQIHYWTDSPSSQYRNRLIFKLVADHHQLYGMKARWNYFEAGHGKGPCDGLGGTTKRMADESVRQGKTTIQDAHDFHKWSLQSSMKGVNFIFVEKSTCDEKFVTLKAETYKPVKNTMKLHAVGGCGSNMLKTKETSCYCDTCLAGDFCNNWQEHCFASGTRKSRSGASVPQELARESNQVADASDDVAQDASDDVAQDASDDVAQDVSNDVAQGVDRDVANDAVLEDATGYKHDVRNDHTSGNDVFNTLDVHDYVAARYEGDWYIGVLENIDNEEGDCEVKFMQHSKGCFKWPSKEDKIWISKTDIICKIQPLVPTGKSCRLFKVLDDDMECINNTLLTM